MINYSEMSKWGKDIFAIYKIHVVLSEDMRKLHIIYGKITKLTKI